MSLSSHSFSTVHADFVSTRYGLSNFYSKHLQDLGVDAVDLFVDVEPLQKAWARDHQVAYNSSNWLYEIAVAQARHYKPDVLFLQDLYLFDADFRRELRQAISNRPFIVGWRTAQTEDFGLFGDVDLILTAARDFVPKFLREGVDADWLPFAFEPSLLAEVDWGTRDLPFTFVGKVGDVTGSHVHRNALLQELLRRTSLEIWGFVDPPPSTPPRKAARAAIYRTNQLLSLLRIPQEARAEIPFIRRGAGWLAGPRSTTSSDKQSRFHGSVFGLSNYSVLGRSEVTFNCHIDGVESASNMRLFEATGMGACLLTDRKRGLDELFKPDLEVVTYGSKAECLENVTYLLNEPSQRTAIAQAGQSRALRDHTYEQRARRLNEILLERK